MNFAIANLIIALLMQGPLTGRPGTVQGIICEVQTCKPIGGARVSLLIPGVEAAFKRTVTDESGTYRFDQVPAGKYDIRVGADNFVSLGGTPIITITDGDDVQDLKTEMRGLAIISGRVFNENGEPVPLAHVEAMAFRWAPGFMVLVPISRADTDDRGTFRIPALEPGEYFIRTESANSKAATITYPLTYYPNTTDPGAASKVIVAAGDEASDIDTRLTPGGVSIRGRFIGEQSRSGERRTLVLIPRSPSVWVAPARLDDAAEPKSDTFEIRVVPPGSYYLYSLTGFNPFAGPQQWVRTPIEVGGADVEDLTIVEVQPGGVHGRVVVDPDTRADLDFDLSKIFLEGSYVELTPYPGLAGFVTRPDKDGAFEDSSVSEGTMFLKDPGLGDGWFISGLRLDGRDVMGSGFSATPGKQHFLEVLISNTGGTVSGVIMDRQNNPLTAGRFVLLPEPSLRANPMLIKTGVAVEKGQFTLKNILPGEYTIIAFPDEDRFAPTFLRDLKSIGEYERFGQRVYIGAGLPTRVDLIAAPAGN